MARFTMKVISGDKERKVIEWYDYTKGKGARARRQVLCDTKANKHIPDKELLKIYKEKERQSLISSEMQTTDYPANITKIEDVISRFRDDREKDVETRKIQGAPEGISQNAFYNLMNSVGIFAEYCNKNQLTKCSKVNAAEIKLFRDWLTSYTGKTGKFSVHSKNKTLRNVKTFLNHFRIETPPVFNNIDILTSILKRFKIADTLTFTFDPSQIQTILKKAAEHDCVKCTVTKESKRKGASKIMPLKYLPVLPHIITILLTGMRRTDAVKLTWDSVDFDNNTIQYIAEKNKKKCIVPLTGYMHGDISPTYIQLLDLWNYLSKGDRYVLPHPGSVTPKNPLSVLRGFRESKQIENLTFQNLRKTFVSFAVTFGIPPATVAFWVGHSPAVAEKHYMEFLQTQTKGLSIEEIMGISDILKNIIKGYKGKGEFANLRLTKWNVMDC